MRAKSPAAPIDRRALLFGAVSPGFVSPLDFGLAGDGTDETDKLQALADYLAAHGGDCALPPGRTYLQSRGVVFSGDGFTLHGNGSIIRMMDGAVSDAWHFGLKFSARRFTVNDLVVDGNRQNRIPKELPCHSFYLDGAVDARFNGCLARNAACDGWIITEMNPSDPAGWCRNITLYRCGADNSFRNGLSIINGYDILIAGGRYDRSNGTAPQAGIDLEANPGGPTPSMERVRLIGVKAKGNRGFAFQVSPVGGPKAVLWDSLQADGAGAGSRALGFNICSPVETHRLQAVNFPADRRTRISLR